MSFWDFADIHPFYALMFFLGGLFIISVLATTLTKLLNERKEEHGKKTDDGR